MSSRVSTKISYNAPRRAGASALGGAMSHRDQKTTSSIFADSLSNFVTKTQPDNKTNWSQTGTLKRGGDNGLNETRAFA